MPNLYQAIHKDNDPEMAKLFYKMKSRKQQNLRSWFLQGKISQDTYEEIMDIIHMASMTELESLDLIKWKNDSDIVEKLRAHITTKEVPTRKKWNSGIRVKLPDSLNHLSGIEKQERNGWLTRTKRLYDRLIRIRACTAQEKEEFEANMHHIQTPIEAERVYLNLYLKHHDKYETVQHNAFCSKCPHCLELKALMEQAFKSDVDDLVERERSAPLTTDTDGEHED